MAPVSAAMRAASSLPSPSPGSTRRTWAPSRRIANASDAGSAIIAAKARPTRGAETRAASHRTIAPPIAPAPQLPAEFQAEAWDWACADWVATISPPHADCTSVTGTPPASNNAVTTPTWELPKSGIVAPTQSAAAAALITSQALRRNLTSMSGAQRKNKNAGSWTSELMRAIWSTGIPAFPRRNGRGVVMNPT